MSDDAGRLDALLREALDGASELRFDVTVVRWLDGHRIPHDHGALTPLEVLALRREEQCHPGDLVTFDVTPAPAAPAQ